MGTFSLAYLTDSYLLLEYVQGWGIHYLLSQSYLGVLSLSRHQMPLQLSKVRGPQGTLDSLPLG